MRYHAEKFYEKHSKEFWFLEKYDPEYSYKIKLERIA